MVLSGGGAKGIAHVPLLQALDSLHIVPDLIIGNSMGSIIGGLYAMGYSGDSIAKITEKINWNHLLGGTMDLKNVGVEEKREFGRYLARIGIKDGKLASVGSLLNDQNLRQYLSELTFPVYNIKDFDKLPIPYRAMATDVVNGKEIVLSEGSLAFAMRASMSLPAVFKAVPYQETLLVDGGVMNNFPTDIAKKMGADIIIGSDVGGGMDPKEKLHDFVSVLMQTSMFPSNLKNPENRNNCTILVDHLPHLRFSTADFKESAEIYKDGKIATAQNIEALTALAQKLKQYPQRNHYLPEIPNEFFIDSIEYKNISKENIPLVKARVKLKPKAKYSTKDLIEGIDRAMGTNLFSQITYNYFITDDNKLGVALIGFEHPKNQLNASLHFDSYRGVGLIVNYTARNVLAQSSRLLVTADIAEQPKARIDFQKNFGKKKDWWWSSELYGSYLQQQIFINGNRTDDINYGSFEFNNQFNKNINSLNSYIGFGLNYGYTKLKPRFTEEYEPEILELDYYNFNNLEINMHYYHNDMDKVFFATSGSIIKANLSRSLSTHASYQYTPEEFPAITGSTNGYTRFSINYEKRLPLSKKTTVMLGFDCNYMFLDPFSFEKQLSFADVGYAAKYFVGGVFPNSGNNRFSFPGLHEDELIVTQLMGIKLAAQTNPFGHFYITPHFNMATVGFGNFDEYIDKAFDPKGNWDMSTDVSLVVSGGAAVSYLSILGPIHLDLSYINNLKKPRLFFSVGFALNP